jgi:spermidine synthase
MRDLDVLAYESSPIGMIGLRRRDLASEPGTVVTEITLDHTILMSSCNSASERALAERALDMHQGEDLKALIGGLGLGYTAREVLRSQRVSHVEVVELVPQVIDWLDRGLLPLAGALRPDSRFAVSAGDVYTRLAGPPKQRHDLVLVDVDHSPEETLAAENDSFYSEEGLARAKRHLAPAGVLGVWSFTESPPFAQALRRVFDEVRVEPVTFENRLIGEQETNWLYFARG